MSTAGEPNPVHDSNIYCKEWPDIKGMRSLMSLGKFKNEEINVLDHYYKRDIVVPGTLVPLCVLPITGTYRSQWSVRYRLY